MCRTALIVTTLSVSLLASGCFNGSSTSSTDGRSTPSHGPAATGTIKGRVFTTACGGPAAASCVPRTYRGSLVFCTTMNEIGPCPSAHVDATGHFEIKLRPGRYALIPAPGNGNVVWVKPRWVSVGDGRTTTMNINGGNTMF
jgi:hypothetical protein